MVMRVKTTNELIDAFTLLVSKVQNKKNENKEEDYFLNNLNTTFKLGKIDSSYSTGRPRIVFEGESSTSLKAYPYLSTYTPVANDIVLLAKVGNSYIVLGKKI